MDNFLENLELKNKKEHKEKFASEDIFHDLRIDNDLKGNNIQKKIMKIKNDQINDLKLIDIRFVPKQAIISQESKSTRYPNFVGQKGITFSGARNENFNKIKLKSILNNKIINKNKEIKLLPYILSPSKNEGKIKSNKLISLTENNVESIKNLEEIKKVKFVKKSLKKENNDNNNNNQNNQNNNELKIFMMKLSNLKKLSKKNSIHNYFKNTNKKKIEIKNRSNTINQTFDKNDFNKNQKLNVILKLNNKTYYSPNQKDKSKFKTENITSFDWNKNNDKINQLNLKINSNENSINDATEEDLLIYKLLQKNEELNEFVIKKAERKEKKKNRTFSKKLKNKIKKNTLVKNLQGKNFSSFNPKLSEKKNNNTVNTEENNQENNYISVNENLPLKKEETIDFLENQIKSLYANFPKIVKSKNINGNNKFYLNNISSPKSSNYRDYDLNLNPANSYSIKTLNNVNDDDLKKKRILLTEEIINLFKDTKIRSSFLNNLKDKEKLKRFLYFLKANNLESNFNKDYENRYGKIKFQKSEIEKMKNKCRNILEELDKKNNFNLDEYIKEFENKDMNVSFLEFFHYLLLILKNYDKKIVNNTYEIKKESKDQPDDVKYSNVTKKHKIFMNLIEKQFNEGKNMDKLLMRCLNKTKREKEIENINSAINKNKNNTLNSTIKQNRYNRNFYITK